MLALVLVLAPILVIETNIPAVATILDLIKTVSLDASLPHVPPHLGIVTNPGLVVPAGAHSPVPVPIVYRHPEWFV